MRGRSLFLFSDLRLPGSRALNSLSLLRPPVFGVATFDHLFLTVLTGEGAGMREQACVTFVALALEVELAPHFQETFGTIELVGLGLVLVVALTFTLLVAFLAWG